MAKARRPSKRYTKLDAARLEVEMAAMRLWEADQTIERGFPNASCSGPERFWMNERLKAKAELMDACRKLHDLRASDSRVRTE